VTFIVIADNTPEKCGKSKNQIILGKFHTKKKHKYLKHQNGKTGDKNGFSEQPDDHGNPVVGEGKVM